MQFQNYVDHVPSRGLYAVEENTISSVFKYCFVICRINIYYS